MIALAVPLRVTVAVPEPAVVTPDEVTFPAELVSSPLPLTNETVSVPSPAIGPRGIEGPV